MASFRIHGLKGLGAKYITPMMKSDRHSPPVGMTVLSVRTMTRVKLKTIPNQRPNKPTDRKASFQYMVRQVTHTATLTQGSVTALTSATGSLGMASPCLAMLLRTI